MKKLSVILTVMILFVVSLTSQAKQPSDYYAGNWTVVSESPVGKTAFTVRLERVDGELVGDIQREGDEEVIEFSKIEEVEGELTLAFISTSQYLVTLYMKEKDENNMVGITDFGMGGYNATGERIE